MEKINYCRIVTIALADNLNQSNKVVVHNEVYKYTFCELFFLEGNPGSFFNKQLL